MSTLIQRQRNYKKRNPALPEFYKTACPFLKETADYPTNPLSERDNKILESLTYSEQSKFDNNAAHTSFLGSLRASGICFKETTDDPRMRLFVTEKTSPTSQKKFY